MALLWLRIAVLLYGIAALAVLPAALYNRPRWRHIAMPAALVAVFFHFVALAEMLNAAHHALPVDTHESLSMLGLLLGAAFLILATVYRTLALLTEKGVVDVLSHHGAEQCYRLCGDEHHHHLLCERCHRVVEVQHCGLDDWVAAAAKQHGFVATDHSVEIVGVCADCR